MCFFRRSDISPKYLLNLLSVFRTNWSKMFRQKPESFCSMSADASIKLASGKNLLFRIVPLDYQMAVLKTRQKVLLKFWKYFYQWQKMTENLPNLFQFFFLQIALLDTWDSFSTILARHFFSYRPQKFTSFNATASKEIFSEEKAIKKFLWTRRSPLRQPRWKIVKWWET